MPDGFVEAWRTKYDAGQLNGLSVRNVKAWVGQNMRVVKVDITNTTFSPIELNERYLWTKGVMAVSYYPKVTMLPPNTRVYAYVVLREVE